MANEHEPFNQRSNTEEGLDQDLSQTKKFSAPWNKKFGEDENFKNRQYSRSARNQPAKEATTLSQVLLFAVIITFISPFILYAVVNSQKDNVPLEQKTAEQVRMNMSSNLEIYSKLEDESKNKESKETTEAKEESQANGSEANGASEGSTSTRRRETTSEPRPTTTAPVPETTTAPEPSQQYYTVQAGDSWYAIASRYGIDVYELAALNGASIDTAIHPGTQIVLP